MANITKPIALDETLQRVATALESFEGIGIQGPPGPGVPAGGTTGKILAKKTGTDYDTEWVDAPSGGGDVDSVNGQTGTVVLDAGDINVDDSAQTPKTVAAELSDLGTKVQDVVVVSSTQPQSANTKIWIDSSESTPVQVPTNEEFTTAVGEINRALTDIEDAIGTTSTTGETTEYLEITKKSRWNNSSTPSSSNAFARTTNVLTLTSAMKKVVSGTGYVLAKVMGSNDGSTYTILNVYWGISEFDISNIAYTYLTVDVQKPDQANFTDDDDVSSAVGIVEEISVETIRDIGNDVGENVDLQTEDKTSLVSAINEVNEKASSSTVTAVRDSIGYTVTGETSRDVELVGRKKFSPYSGTIGNDTARAYGEFTKSAEDISVNLSAKGTYIYYLGDVYYSTDNWATFTLYANVSSGNPFGPDQTNWNISGIPLNASVRVNIYKPNYAEFATDEDLTDVMTVISSQLTLRTIESVDDPSDMIGALLNRARQESKTLNIKLLGDSITHGVGSTGFNGATATTEPQSYDFTVILNGSTTYVTRSTGENSWAAKFETYMYEKYGSNVTNNGVSGGNAKMIIDSWETLVAESDDLIICMIGTNDRMQYNDAKLKETFRMQIETIQHKADLMGIPILFMSVVPVPVYYETHTVDGVEHTLTMHAEDIENIVHLVSKAEHHGYVSMFTGILNYAEYRNIDFTTLLSDNLHPNDNGYKVMYDILMESIGLGRKIPGATW